MTDTAIHMEHVRRTFSKRTVLADITGVVPAGRVVGLLGENGEGKTTLFRILLDILAPDSGTVLVNGRRADGSGRIRLHTGYVPERPAFHEFLTAGSALEMRSRIYPRWDGQKAQHLAKRLKLDLSTPLRGASKGTLAKTAWICATAHNPATLLLDEPTSGLDALVRESVLTQLVSELAEEGKTILVANHRMEEMLNVLDEVWLLSGGVIREKREVEDLRARSVRISGRLKSPLPAGLRVFQEHRSGSFVRWAVLDPETAEKIAALHLLDAMETEPLPVEVAFKLMLARKEEEHVR